MKTHLLKIQCLYIYNLKKIYYIKHENGTAKKFNIDKSLKNFR